MKFIQYYVFCAAIALFFSCKKQSDSVAPPQTPNTAKTYIVLKEVPSKTYLAEKGHIDIKGSINGERESYNFMEVSVVDQFGDTLGKTFVDGKNFSIRIDSTLAAGEYHVTALAKDPDDENKIISSLTVAIIACYPPPTEIVKAQASDRYNTVTWQKTNIYSFKQYEVYAYKRGETPKLIATINDVNTTTFTDTSAYFFYSYFYMVKVVNQQDCSSQSNNSYVQSGHFLELSDDPDMLNSVYHDGKGSFHFMMTIDTYYTYLVIVDADSIDGAFGVKAYTPGSYLAGLDETNKLQVMQPENNNTVWRLNWFDIVTGWYDYRPVTSNLPLYTDRIKIVWGDLALYTSRHDNKDFVAMYNHNTQQKTPVWDGEYLNVIPIKNKERFVITTKTDSFFVYSMTGGMPELQKKGSIPGLHLLPKKNVFSGTGLFTIGGNMYDDNYNLVHSLNSGEAFIGLSTDGQYAVSNQNEIFETTGFNMIHKYGDGVGGVVYFSKDNKTIAHVTSKYDHYDSNKIFQYRWRE